MKIVSGPEIIEQPVAVIGGGVIGLAIARLLAMALGPEQVVLLEKHTKLGEETTARNSEVIHAGFNHPKDFLKARLCVSGNRLLYDYCQQKGVPHRKIGKLVVATDDTEIPTLERLKEQGETNGVEGLRWLSRREIQNLEPEVAATTGFYSAETGIVDSHRLVTSLRQDVEDAGGFVVVSAPVADGEVREDGIRLRLDDSDGSVLLCSTVINAAGLYAQKVALSLRGYPPDQAPIRHLAKGHYYSLSGKSPFSHLVYPVPDSNGGLGVHVTLDLAGQARFGPDLSTVTEIDYSFDESRLDQFYRAIVRYFPALRKESLQPGFTGIRPKIGPPGTGPIDFIIQDSGAHGVPGLINLFGIESPGLTASLAIAEEVSNRVLRIR